VLSFGRAGDVRWDDVRLDDLGRPSFVLEHAGGRHPVTLTQSGAHQVANAAAAAALAIAAGVDLTAVAARLGTARPASRWQMELHERPDGLVVVNDAYNANPSSMAAAIEALAGIADRRPGRGIAVLGEMLELGQEARQAHLDVGRRAAEAGIDVVVTVGEQAALIGQGADSVGGWRGRTVGTAGRDEALTWVRNNVAAGDVVLVKASRGAALEHVADGLLTEGGTSR
jgi:UDP-N-acetylmuramoyl-tripeptide--D-alanyl-D-alanine ligase